MGDKGHFLKLVVDRDDEFDPHDWMPPLDRRAALRMLGMSAMASIVGCGTGGTPSASSGSSGSTSLTSTTTTLTAPASATTSASVTMTATVSPAAATGAVTFYNGSASLGSGTLSSGSASLAASFSTAGTETLKAVYAGDSTYAGSTSNAVSMVVSALSSACSSQTLEGEEGPYFVDDSATGYNRSNILSNLDGTDTQTGVPLSLTVYVYDAKNSCAAMENVQIDIWHCNAAGVYSAEASESTTGQSWLRGYQLTNANGMVQFATVIPGWYSGRPRTSILGCVPLTILPQPAAITPCRCSSIKR